MSLSYFRGNSCFVIFNVTRAVLETLPSHMHLVAWWPQRAAVKSRHTQQRFVLWLRRLHELSNPWKWFKCLVMFRTHVSRSFAANFFPCSVVWCSASARGLGSPSLRETLLVRIPREALLHNRELQLSFVVLFQSLLSACTRDPCLFFSLSRG